MKRPPLRALLFGLLIAILGTVLIAGGLALRDLSAPSGTGALTPEALREAEQLRNTQIELARLWSALTAQLPAHDAPEALGFRRRAQVEIRGEINTFRRGQLDGRWPGELGAGFLAAADRLAALADDPFDDARRRRAQDAVRTAIEAAQSRIEALDADNALTSRVPDV